MAATLQERLNYLVNYSSQLIFVGGDSLASQTKALESFLFQQGENTEIAYVVAEPDADIADFRQQLCQQLLGQPSQFYHRPLNECLASLNSFAGPVMIAITRAEQIPRKLLQELWELVLQSRFAGNKQHLNVVLFADKSWAQEAKSWLPANNSGTPLLLSTQQASLYKAMPGEGQFDNLPTRLDNSLLADDEHEIEQRPLVSMGAFWAAVILVFVCVFIGVAVWQKGDQISALFEPLDIQSSSTLPVIPEETKTTVSVWQKKPEPEVNATVENTSPQPEIAIEKEPENPTYNAQPEPVQVAQDTSVTTTLKAGLFAIQLAGFQDKALLERFVLENNLQSATQVYQTQRNGSPWFVIISKQLYSSAGEARNAIVGLPEFPSKNNVFIKSSDAIIKEQLNAF